MSHVIYWDKVKLVKARAQDETRGIANDILDRAQMLAPVDTGYLRASGFVDGWGNDYIIGFTAHYAHFQEFGTSRHRAQPFLRPAIGAVFY